MKKLMKSVPKCALSASRICLNDSHVNSVAIIVYKKYKLSKSTIINKLLYLYK